uniref:Uncharacterized protein n=1 Tax=Arundo donax TaxID=35708 RepID=A0A0A8YIL3_ARUDO
MIRHRELICKSCDDTIIDSYLNNYDEMRSVS